MNFKDALEHYRAGTATEEEAALVEAELEKTQLIAEYLDEAWDIQTPDAPPPDYRKVRKKLLHSRLFLVLIPILVIALVTAMLPFGNVFFYDPTEQSYEAFSSDLDLYLTAYTELFHPGYVYFQTLVNRTGIGNYQMDLVRWANATGKQEFVSAAITRGSAALPRDFNSLLTLNIIARASYPVYDMEPEHKAQVRRQLEQLPEYIEVTAALSFPEDHPMTWLLEFQEQFDGSMVWTGIRNAPEDEQRYPLCGLNLHTSGVIHEQINNWYPAFETAELEKTPEMWEQHFESLLQYIVDHPEITDVMGLERVDYYEDVLAYIREQGVKSYGCVVQTSARELLRLLDEGIVTQVWPMDADISL